MIHASVELVEAMRGECPVFPFESPNISGPHARKACAPGAIANERIIWAYAGRSGWMRPNARGISEDNWNPVTCHACLTLMAEARGPERTAALAIRADELEEELAAYEQRIKAAPTCGEAMSLNPGGVCGGVLRWGGRQILECMNCLARRRFGAKKVARVIEAWDAMRLRNDTSAAVAAIRSAVPVVPGVAKENER